MPDDGSPEGRIVVGWHDYGFVAMNQEHIIVEGLKFRHADTGLNLQRSALFTVADVITEDNFACGINAFSTSAGTIRKSMISRSGRNGIKAFNAKNIKISGNTVVDTGVFPEGAPKKSIAAIESGPNTIIEDNIIKNSGYCGIVFPGQAPSSSDIPLSIVQRNVIENSCLLLDDCGAIYTSTLSD